MEVVSASTVTACLPFILVFVFDLGFPSMVLLRSSLELLEGRGDEARDEVLLRGLACLEGPAIGSSSSIEEEEKTIHSLCKRLSSLVAHAFSVSTKFQLPTSMFLQTSIQNKSSLLRNSPVDESMYLLTKLVRTKA